MKTFLVIIGTVIGLVLGLIIVGMVNAPPSETPEALSARRMECSKSVISSIGVKIGNDSPTVIAGLMNNMTHAQMNKVMSDIPACRGFEL